MPMTLSEFREKTFVIVAVLYGAFAVLLAQIPLFNYLGYEFSASLGIFIGIVAGFTTISWYKKFFPVQPSRKDFFSFVRRSLLKNAILLLIPLVLISLNAFFVKNCSWLEGIEFFLLFPIITMFFAFALALCCAILFKKPAALYAVISALILFHPVYLTYSRPQLFAYNFFFGFFPGFSYDEVLKISRTLLLFRGFTIVAAMFFFTVAFFVFQRKTLKPLVTYQRKLSLFFIGATSLLLFLGYLGRERLGFESSTSTIQHALGSKYVTPHFSIYYSQSVVSQDQIRWIAAEHEFRYQQVSRFLNVRFHQKIDSYLYPTPELKKRLIGTSTTDIAKPWRSEIHLNVESLHNTLKHELVHAIAGDFGMPILRASISVGLIEGLAVAADWNVDDRTPHQNAAALKHFGAMADVKAVLSFSGFASHSPSISYLLVGSFCRYLIETYGIEKFKRLYPFGNFSGVYHASLEELVDEWKEFLSSFQIPSEENARIKFFFQRSSIFHKVCARSIASETEEAVDLLKRKFFQQAADRFEQLAQLGNVRETMFGLMQAKYALRQYDDVITRINAALNDSALASQLIPLKLLAGDAYWMRGETNKAFALYQSLREFDLFERYNEAAALRMEMAWSPRFMETFKKYLEPDASDSAKGEILEQITKVAPRHSVAQYLLAKQLLQQKNYKASLEHLEKIQKPFSDHMLNFLKEKMFGLSYFYLKKFQQAKIYFWQSLNFLSTEAYTNQIDDWIEKCDWMDEHREVLD